MKAKIEILMDNAVFDDGNSGYELARILRHIEKEVDGEDFNDPLSPYREFEYPIHDSNGNRVGMLTIK